MSGGAPGHVRLHTVFLPVGHSPSCSRARHNDSDQQTDTERRQECFNKYKEAALLESWKAYKTGFQQGVALFNKKPKKGIAFMQEQVRQNHSHAELCSM